ncbi:MAG: hypothetical protein QQN41_11315 [Nitrosopumilus sp.]
MKKRGYFTYFNATDFTDYTDFWATESTARPWASPFGRNQKIKERLLRIRRMFFASAFLFAASVSCEGGKKRTTAKNKRPKVPF